MLKHPRQSTQGRNERANLKVKKQQCRKLFCGKKNVYIFYGHPNKVIDLILVDGTVKKLKKGNTHLSKEECLNRSWYMYNRIAYGWDIARWLVRVVGAHEVLASTSITAKNGGIETHATV